MQIEQDVHTYREQLRRLEREVVGLSQSDIDLDGFFRQFLQMSVEVLGVGGAIWIRTETGEVALLARVNLDAAGLQEDGHQADLLARSIQQVLETGNATVLPARAGSGELGVNDSPHALFFMPVVLQQKVTSVVLLIGPQELEPQALQGFAGYITGLMRHIEDFLQRRRLEEVTGQMGRINRFREYISSLHSSLEAERCCYALANFGQELLGVYRCMAGTYSLKGKFRLHAVSGLESVAIKSGYVRTIAQLARQVCRNNKDLLVDNPDAAHQEVAEADDLTQQARLYMLGAKVAVMGIFPIRHQQRVVGAFIVEQSKEEPIDEVRRQEIDAICVEAAGALRNCLALQELPLARLLKPVARLKEKVYTMGRVRAYAWAALWAVLLIAPLVITRPVKVIGSAELTPIEAKKVYVQLEGVLEEVLVASGEAVAQGQVLARLDTQVIDAQLDHVEKAIQQATLSLSLARNDSTMRQIQQTQLDLSLAEKAKLLEDREKFMIVSPAEGIVVSRESAIRQLQDKPVVHGEEVFEIVPVGTAWRLAVSIPEAEAGEFLKAHDALEEGQAIEARVLLNAYPDKALKSRVVSVSPRAYVLTTGPQKYHNVVEVLVEQPEEFEAVVTDPRPGLEGKVAFYCEQRNLYYTLSYKLVNFLRVKFF